jgi:FlaG/FlaF family flagellin (archaellin)
MEVLMKNRKIIIAVCLVIVAALMLTTAGCFGSTAAGSSSETTPTVVQPQPRVENVTATTSGTQSAYYATLDIKVKNDGAEGTILVQASITQKGKTSQNEMPVFLKHGESHELKLTFPLVWQGGDFTSDVKTIVP